MDRCSPSGMEKCHSRQLNPHPQFFRVSRVVFIRERPFFLPGSTGRRREFSWRTSLALVRSRLTLGPPVPDGTLVTERSNSGIVCNVTSVCLAWNYSSFVAVPCFLGFSFAGATVCLFCARRSSSQISFTFPCTESRLPRRLDVRKITGHEIF